MQQLSCSPNSSSRAGPASCKHHRLSFSELLPIHPLPPASSHLPSAALIPSARPALVRHTSFSSPVCSPFAAQTTSIFAQILYTFLKHGLKKLPLLLPLSLLRVVLGPLRAHGTAASSWHHARTAQLPPTPAAKRLPFHPNSSVLTINREKSRSSPTNMSCKLHSTPSESTSRAPAPEPRSDKSA